ncbi:MAG TPA: hypothetical protein VFV50_02085, partial [Bdellovibrionales bacterium]|nr:hypothetical protein [Bdellovibrionales bacterium]
MFHSIATFAIAALILLSPAPSEGNSSSKKVDKLVREAGASIRTAKSLQDKARALTVLRTELRAIIDSSEPQNENDLNSAISHFVAFEPVFDTKFTGDACSSDAVN